MAARHSSELAVVGEAREGNDVPDVLDARAELHQALEAKPEACVRDGTVTAQVQVPPVAVGVETAVDHASREDVHTILALGPADQLADPAAQYKRIRQRIPTTRGGRQLVEGQCTSCCGTYEMLPRVWWCS